MSTKQLRNYRVGLMDESELVDVVYAIISKLDESSEDYLNLSGDDFDDLILKGVK